MAIILDLAPVMTERKIGLTELSDTVGINLVSLSALKNNRAEAMRFSTLDAICKALDCQPGDILTYVPDEEADALTTE